MRWQRCALFWKATNRLIPGGRPAPKRAEARQPISASFVTAFPYVGQVTAKKCGIFSLTGLDGSKIYVIVESIMRIRASIAEDGPPATEVEYGAGYIFTHKTIADLLARIGTADRFPPADDAGRLSRLFERSRHILGQSDNFAVGARADALRSGSPVQEQTAAAIQPRSLSIDEISRLSYAVARLADSLSRAGPALTSLIGALIFFAITAVGSGALRSWALNRV